MFNINQPIVCVDDSDLPQHFPVINKDKTYTSMGMSPTGQDVYIKETGPATREPYYGYLASRFRPIEYADITASLAQQVVIGDTADQPVRVKVEGSN